MAITDVLPHEEQIDIPSIALALCLCQSVVELPDPAVLRARIASVQANIPLPQEGSSRLEDER